ncbi:MAG: hypothetical protein KBD46_03295 [Candidatus Levybacteria bacterium]|nr:hypothetical protein [Candidatus Levybacteria bacterium]
MQLKLLQLNIFQGKFLPQIIDYVKKHDFDILQFQEVSGGSMSKGGVWSGERAGMTASNPKTVGIDCFETIKEKLTYQGVLNITIAKRDDHTSYFGNATFFKPTLKLEAMQEIFLKPYGEVGDTPFPPQDAPRAALTTTFSLNNKDITFINCHLAWGPTSEDEPHKVAQGKILYEYVKSLTTPFVLTGDFNVDQNSQVVTWMNSLGRNLVTEKGIINTLNPNIHPAKVFPPGLGVDFAFVTKDIKVTDFHLVDTPDLSDHLGLSLTLEI